MTQVKLAPSILTADFGRLREEIAAVAPQVDWFHLDVMDGHYVPNITFGPMVVEVVRGACELPLHVHLMIENPADFVERFVAVGADRISFHPEVTEDPAAVIGAIRSAGAGPGIAVHPDSGLEAVQEHLGEVDVILMMTVRPGFGGQRFMPEVVPKIARARALVDGAGASAEVEVDGGINADTVGQVLDAGADIVVAGSAIYDGRDPVEAAKRLRRAMEEKLGAAR